VQRVKYSRPRAAAPQKMGRVRLCCEVSYDGTGLLGWQAQRSQLRATLHELAAEGAGGECTAPLENGSAALPAVGHAVPEPGQHVAKVKTTLSTAASGDGAAILADDSDDDAPVFNLFEDNSNDDNATTTTTTTTTAASSSYTTAANSNRGADTAGASAAPLQLAADDESRAISGTAVATTTTSAPEPARLGGSLLETTTTCDAASTDAAPTPRSVSEIVDAAVRPVLAEALCGELQQAPSFAVAVSRTDAGVHARAALVSFNLKIKVRDQDTPHSIA
jgi:hypothetical protein